MAKQENNENLDRRSSRREALLARKQERQMRQARRALYAVLGVIGFVLLAALIIEFAVVPSQVVVEVNDDTITIAEWQEEVRSQRAQFIADIERQYNLFLGEDEADEAAQNQALRFVQQFSGQQIVLLAREYERLGESVLDQMINNELVRDGAAERGIEVSDAAVDDVIGERFNYFDGESPTPQPSATPGPDPTPTITPIPLGQSDTITETVAPAVDEPVVEEEPAADPTPRPTATPVSEASYQEQLQEELDRLREAGGSEEFFREQARDQLYRERLAEAIYEEQGLPTEVPHASAYFLVFETENAAQAQLALIDDAGFLEVWNTIRSIPQEQQAELQNRARATEFLNRTQVQYEEIFSESVPEALFELPVGESSGIIQDTDNRSGLPIYVIFQLSSREERPLSPADLDRRQQEALNDWLDEQLATADITRYENWRSRIPRQPVLDAFYTQPAPTPVPTSPVSQPPQGIDPAELDIDPVVPADPSE